MNAATPLGVWGRSVMSLVQAAMDAGMEKNIMLLEAAGATCDT